MNDIVIFWFRRDLRLADNPGLAHAATKGLVIPIYILDNTNENPFILGGASKWWLHDTLGHLQKSLNNNLNIYVGSPFEIIRNIIKCFNVKGVYWNRCYDPYSIQRDSNIKRALEDIDIDTKSFNGSLLVEPWEVIKQDKSYYKIYTAFYNAALKAERIREPIKAPQNICLFKDMKNSLKIDDLKLLDSICWHKKFELCWQTGETYAFSRLQNFISKNIDSYAEKRNYPDLKASSRLSPHLAFGEISPHQIMYHLHKRGGANLECFKKEIYWREFSYYILYHFPSLPFQNFRNEFDNFPWTTSQSKINKFTRGETGYPIIDAGMKELWETGYMHNRVRMIVASFLTKNLLIDWTVGAKWFLDCLLDADIANNSASWQWVAGSGVDSAPYFRIFNPVLQGEKFDHDGSYVRRFLPTLQLLPNKFIHKPFLAPKEILLKSGIYLGKNYPEPIVSLETSRKLALECYRNLRK